MQLFNKYIINVFVHLLSIMYNILSLYDSINVLEIINIRSTEFHTKQSTYPFNNFIKSTLKAGSIF